MRRFAAILAGLALVAVLVVGLTQAGGEGGGKAAEEFDLATAKRELAGAPAPLAALHEQSAQLLEGGPRAFRKRLAALKGYPVVVNKWASWGGPCPTELPVLHSQAGAPGCSSRTRKRSGFSRQSP